VISTDDFIFLRELTAAVMKASKVHPGEIIRGCSPNVSGGTLIRPGGRNCYPAFWVRDFAMSLECGLITQDEQLHALHFTAKKQARQDWHSPCGGFVPKGAIVDHISFDGKPIFYPGTYDYGKQGEKKWGVLPSLDDHFYFIDMAWNLAMVEKYNNIVNMNIEGIPLMERLEAAFNVPPLDKDGLMVCCGQDERGVSFGFTDTVIHTGKLLFCSLLRCRAAKRLSELFSIVKAYDKIEMYTNIAKTMSKHIPEVFAHNYGLLKSSTEISSQPDVWASAFAVYCGLLSPEATHTLSVKLTQCLEKELIAWQGNIRHVPTDADYSADSAWESSMSPKNTYQNGAYWGTPTGWVAYTVALQNHKLAEELINQYIQELRVGDFRKGTEFGSPWECMHYDGNHRQNPVYLASVTCPLAAFSRLHEVCYRQIMNN
jgi:hypothetical protein